MTTRRLSRVQMMEIEPAHCADLSTELDDVADVIGPQDQDQYPRRHVRQRALQRKTDGQRRGAQHGDDRGGLHA